MSERQVYIEPSEDAATSRAAELIRRIAAEAFRQRAQFNIALAGGTTPHRLYEYLARPEHVETVPWSATNVFFGDERDVPHDHAESNFRMAQKSLLGAVPIRLENVHPMPADAHDLDRAADQYAQSIVAAVPAGPTGKPAFDLILLGVGGDGHTASLFPNSPALAEMRKLVIAQQMPGTSRFRMSLTFPLINAAQNVLFLVTERDKAEIVRRVLDQDGAKDDDLPAARIRPEYGSLIFVLDANAGRLARQYQTKEE